jgi:hypothetical protein
MNRCTALFSQTSGDVVSTRIDHITGGIYRISTWVPEYRLTFNQFLIDDERPTLVHTGEYDRYDDIRKAISEVLDPATLANIVRDVEDHEPTQWIVGIRVAPVVGRLHEVLLTGYRVRGRRQERLAAALAVVLDFHTWRTLHRAGLDPQARVETAVAMIRCQ